MIQVADQRALNGEPFTIRFTVDAFRDMLREQFLRGLKPVACLVSQYDRRALVDDMHATAVQPPPKDDADKYNQLILILEGCKILEHSSMKRGQVRLIVSRPQGEFERDADRPVIPTESEQVALG